MQNLRGLLGGLAPKSRQRRPDRNPDSGPRSTSSCPQPSPKPDWDPNTRLDNLTGSARTLSRISTKAGCTEPRQIASPHFAAISVGIRISQRYDPRLIADHLSLSKEFIKRQAMSARIPCPPPLPLLGNLIDIDVANSIRSFFELSKTYGTALGVSTPCCQILIPD